MAPVLKLFKEKNMRDDLFVLMLYVLSTIFHFCQDVSWVEHMRNERFRSLLNKALNVICTKPSLMPCASSKYKELMSPTFSFKLAQIIIANSK